MQTLEDIKARFPKNRQHDVQAAFELGLGNLKAALDKPGPRPTPNGVPGPKCINDAPADFAHVLNMLVVAKQAELCLPHFLEPLSRDEQRLLKPFGDHIQRFLANGLTSLVNRGVLVPQEGQTPLQAAKKYVEEMADIHFEMLWELNSAADPREPWAAARMYNELGLVAAEPEPEAQMQVA